MPTAWPSIESGLIATLPPFPDRLPRGCPQALAQIWWGRQVEACLELRVSSQWLEYPKPAMRTNVDLLLCRREPEAAKGYSEKSEMKQAQRKQSLYIRRIRHHLSLWTKSLKIAPPMNFSYILFFAKSRRLINPFTQIILKVEVLRPIYFVMSKYSYMFPLIKHI